MSDMAKKERADRAGVTGKEVSYRTLLTVQVFLYVISGRITFENVL